MVELKVLVFAFLTGMAAQLACLVAVRAWRKFLKKREEKRIRDRHLALRLGPGGTILRRPIA